MERARRQTRSYSLGRSFDPADSQYAGRLSSAMPSGSQDYYPQYDAPAFSSPLPSDPRQRTPQPSPGPNPYSQQGGPPFSSGSYPGVQRELRLLKALVEGSSLGLGAHPVLLVSQTRRRIRILASRHAHSPLGTASPQYSLPIPTAIAPPTLSLVPRTIPPRRPRPHPEQISPSSPADLTTHRTTPLR